MIEPGKHVKLFFRNGLIEEGVVISWSDRQSVLKSLSSDNLLIIQDTAHDIVAIKVFVYPHLEQEDAPKDRPSVYVDKELELPEPERDIQVRALKLAELRTLRAHEERENARVMMTTFRNSGNYSLDQMEKYGEPTRLQEPPRFNSAKETRSGRQNRNR